MKFTSAVAATALVAGAAAYTPANNVTSPVYVTEVVSAFTTYCPSATQITQGGKTYTITTATTLTITNCPCTITKPASTPAVVVPTSAPVVVKPSSSAVVVPPAQPYTSVSAAPKPSSNGTVSTPVLSYTAPVVSASGTPTKATPSAFTGAANKAFTASGAGLAAVFGFAAYIL